MTFQENFPKFIASFDSSILACLPGGRGGGGGGEGYSHILAIQECATGKGTWFSSHLAGMGSSNHRKLVLYRVPFNGITHKRYRVTKFSLVKGRTFENPAAHPHPNYMGVPPPPRGLSSQKINVNLGWTLGDLWL